MIVLKPKAGLCNRMRAVSSAVSLSKKYNAALIILWNRDKGLNCRFGTLFEDIPGVKIFDYHLHFDFISFLCGIFFRHKYKDVRIRDRKKYEKDIADGKNVFISTYSNLSEEDNFRCFKIKKEILNIINDIVPENSENYVGIHIRRTDHSAAIENSPTELFIEEMEKCLLENPYTKFFVATDDKTEEDNLRQIFGDRIITNTNKVLSRNSRQGMIDALIDLGCLKNCCKIIGSCSSSFSSTAAEWDTEKPILRIDKRE